MLIAFKCFITGFILLLVANIGMRLSEEDRAFENFFVGLAVFSLFVLVASLIAFVWLL